MPRVLIVSRHFPPIGGAGVHRTLGSMRHLREFGWETTLVTGPGSQRGRWDSHDSALLERIPNPQDVYRVTGQEPPGSSRVGAQLQRLAQSTERWVQWWIDESVELGARVGADADVILISCAPYATATAGARLSLALGKPWIADLEDSWALDEMRTQPTALHQRGDMRAMRDALTSASAIIMAAPEAAVRMQATMGEAGPAVHSIPIGFEPEDFTHEPPPRDDGVFRIVHTGSMHTELGLRLRRTRLRRRLLGGAAPGLDVLTRSHVFLVEAIDRLLASEPRLVGKIELHLAGNLTDGDRGVAAQHDFIRSTGLLPHSETVALMRSADLLFLPMHDLPTGTRAGLIPYKTFEYLATRRPILAAVPDGDVRDMLAPFSHVSLVRPADVVGLAHAVHAQLTDALGARHHDATERSSLLDGLERQECVRQIAEIFDKTVARAAFRTGERRDEARRVSAVAGGPPP